MHQAPLPGLQFTDAIAVWEAPFALDSRPNCITVRYMKKIMAKNWAKPRLKKSTVFCECTAYAGSAKPGDSTK
jgi:hypothetical protein